MGWGGETYQGPESNYIFLGKKEPISKNSISFALVMLRKCWCTIPDTIYTVMLRKCWCTIPDTIYTKSFKKAHMREWQQRERERAVNDNHNSFIPLMSGVHKMVNDF